MSGASSQIQWSVIKEEVSLWSPVASQGRTKLLRELREHCSEAIAPSLSLKVSFWKEEEDFF